LQQNARNRKIHADKNARQNPRHPNIYNDLVDQLSFYISFKQLKDFPSGKLDRAHHRAEKNDQDEGTR
jgi:hypothetical protein